METKKPIISFRSFSFQYYSQKEPTLLDIVVYGEPANLVFTQGAVAALWNAVSMGVIGTILLFLYSKTRAGKGTLSKE